MPNYTKPLWIVLNPKGEPVTYKFVTDADAEFVGATTAEEHARNETMRWNAVSQGYCCVKATLSWEEA